MKRFLAVLLFASTVACVSNPAAFAADADPDINITIQEGSDDINDDASTPEGETVVIDRIEKEFDVDEATVKALRDKKLGYGEIAIALSLAERLPGGVTDENIDKVISMRQGPPVQGWGNVARDLDLSLKPAAKHLEKVGAESMKVEAKKEQVRHEKSQKLEKAGRPEKAGKLERIERVEKIEKIERPERGGRK